MRLIPIKAALCLCLSGLYAAQGLAQSMPEVLPAAPAATIHIFQSRAFGLLSPKYRVYANGKLLCKMGRNRHCEVALPAEATTFTAKIPFKTFGTPPPLTLTLEPGKSYYLQGDLAPAGTRIPGLAYGFSEVVPNTSKLTQIAEARKTMPLAPYAP